MKFSGIIIAGGKSSRMGFDKTGIEFNNLSFLNRAIHLLEKFTDDVIISINQDLDFDYHIVRDEIQEIGPIGGLYTALKNIKNEMALVIPVDTPLLSEDALKFLLENYETNYQACVFEINGKLEALVGVYHKNILSEIEEQIRKKDYKMQNLLKKSVARKINGNIFATYFFNVNTPADLKKLNNNYATEKY